MCEKIIKEAVIANMLSCNNMPSTDEILLIKKKQISSYLVYNIVSMGKMAGKADPFSWRSVEDELAVKYLGNLDV